MAHPLVIVTGASRGFGRSLALALAPTLAQSGPVSLVLWARDAAGLQETASRVSALAPNVRTFIRVVDLVNTDALLEHWRSVEEIFPAGTISHAYFVQNAGSLGNLQSLASMTDYSWLAREVALNVTAPMILASLFLRWCHGGAGPVNTRESIILNISSLAAIQPFRCWASYCSGAARFQLKPLSKITRCISSPLLLRQGCTRHAAPLHRLRRGRGRDHQRRGVQQGGGEDIELRSRSS